MDGHELAPSPAVGAGEGLVEHLHYFVDDAGVRPGQGGEKDRVATLGGHGPQRLWGRASSYRGQLACALGADGGEVEAVRSQLAQVGQLGDLGLDGIRRPAGGPPVEPDQRGETKLGVGHDQQIELPAARRGELGPQAPVDLPLGGGLGLGD